MKRGWEFSEGQVRFRILLIELEVFSWRQKKPQNPLSCYLSCHQQSPFRKQAGKMQSIPVDEQTESCCRKTLRARWRAASTTDPLPGPPWEMLGVHWPWRGGFIYFFFSLVPHMEGFKCQTKGTHQKNTHRAVCGMGSSALSSKIKQFY